MYSESQVEHLLPAVWDRTFAWGIQNPIAPDPDMPKAKYRSPKEATTFWCHLIDIRMAWERAPLTMFQRRALLMHYGLGWEHQEIADYQSVSRSAVTKRLANGVDVMAEWLNAKYESGEEEPDE